MSAGPARGSLRTFGLAVLAVALFAVGVLALAGRSGPARPAAGDAGPGASAPSTSRLVAQARLEPCPGTRPAAPVPGGLPAITLSCLGGGPAIDLAALRGRPTLVNLWAGWCGPCQKEAPALQSLAARSRGRLRVLGVLSHDSARDGLAAAHGLGIHYPSVFDEDGRLGARLGLLGLPATLFVDGDGRVVFRVPRQLPAGPELAALVAAHLGVRV